MSKTNINKVGLVKLLNFKIKNAHTHENIHIKREIPISDIF